MGPVLALLLAQAAAKPAAVAPNLAVYLKQHPNEAGFAVSADERTALKAGLGLARYNRKAVRLGGLTAIVPLNMVVFDDSLKPSPNLYDGLPRESKVLYLLSILRSDQRLRAAGRGIGLGDLQGEARQVFASLLPKSVHWTSQRLNKEAAWGDELAKGDLSEAQIQGLRLRVERQLQFEIPLVGQPNSYIFHNASEERGQPGETVLVRNTDDEYERKETFGVTIQKTVPNTLKPGQIDTSKLNATIDLPATSTIGEAVTLAGRATGREILADLRVRDRKVTGPGGKVRVGDLLDALAMAVEGTYRRVGEAFMLVSDVTGLGARKLRFTVWEQDLTYALRQKEARWRESIAASGGLSGIGYDEEGGLAPSAAMRKAMDERKPEDHGKWTPTSEFTPGARAFLDRVNLRYSTQKVDTTKARTNWEVCYRFVTAEGDAFQKESVGIGRDRDFEGNRFARQRDPAPAVPKPTLDPADAIGLTLVARTATEATTAVEFAKRYGFGELWLDTTRVEALRAALDTGFPTRLVVRPWAAEPGTDPRVLDRSILGETAAQAAVRIDRSEAAVSAAQGNVRTGWEREPVPKDPTDVFAPDSPALARRWAMLQSLAKTAGLKGVVIRTTQPSGYERDAPDGSRGGERTELLDLAALGYTDAARLSFARKHSLDPIDLTDRGLMFSADLRPPFFLDDALRGSWSVYGGTQNPLPQMATLPKEWAKSRAEANGVGIQRLLTGMPAEALWVETRLPERRTNRPPWTSLQSWKPGLPLPTAELRSGGFRTEDPVLIALPEAEADFRNGSIGSMLAYFAKSAKTYRSLDLGDLPFSAWESRLRLWLTPKAP